MAELPTGTVTFLFTDIEGSTRLLQELGERFHEILLDHRAKLRDVFARHNGVEVGTEGDSFFIAFSRATDAATAAIEAQQVLSQAPVKVRMGLHTGEPAIVDDDYAGIDVHRAARISSAAHGGQVVISERTRSFLSDEQNLRDLGLHRLKDLATPEKLFQLGPGDFPPLRSLNATNLPTQPGPLIGRRREITELKALATERRVVTLTGPGGTGKTRLALEAAAELVGHFKDGVFWVPLAPVRDPELVLPTIAGVLGTDVPLSEHIGEKRMLLLLDNLEQLVECASQIAELTTRCPNLHLLVTSRAPLRIDGEREYAVDPLPDADAVALFKERAVQSEPEHVVAEICRRVDRLPLAIELAAARTRLFTPTQLLERLDQRLPLLTSGRRDLPERQRTLRAAIEWSHDLLSTEAKELFARLAVFSGSFDVEGTEAVADAPLDALERLVEESLIRQREGRFSMLETIREYAHERLAASGDLDVLRERHAMHFLALTERAAAELGGEQVGDWIRRMTEDQDNVRAAIAWTLDTGAAAEALRLCIALTDHWEMRSHLEEGVRWFDRALSIPAEIDPPLRALALRQSGMLMVFANRGHEAVHRLDESIALWRQIGDPMGLSGALRAMGSALGLIDHDAARVVLAEALEITTRMNDRDGERRVLHLLGEVERDAGRFDEAVDFFERSIAIAHELGALMYVGGTTHSLADLEIDRGNLARAEELYTASLRNAVDNELDRHKVYCLAGLASVAALRGDDERAARLWQGVEHAEELLRFRLLEAERKRYVRAVGGLPQPAGPPLGLDDAVDLALR